MHRLTRSFFDIFNNIISAPQYLGHLLLCLPQSKQQVFCFCARITYQCLLGWQMIVDFLRLDGHFKVHPSVLQALAEKKPVVALESTIITHGMPYPKNLRYSTPTVYYWSYRPAYNMSLTFSVNFFLLLQYSKTGGVNCPSRRSHSSHGWSDRGQRPCWSVTRGAGSPGQEQRLPEGVSSWSSIRHQQSETRWLIFGLFIIFIFVLNDIFLHDCLLSSLTK